ncbi:MAG: murein biosynthesis integral membrane protein MurJ [Rhodospirillales bacterium]|nr:murein biosynthesis integral membrane protein MurJ [Rhodospirillales bacterium]
MSLLRAIATIGSFTMLSRITGFARDILIAGLVGAGTVADAFFVAFKFPNLFRRLFAEGAFSAAFVPLFAGLHEKEGPEAARRFAEQAMAVLAWTLLFLVAAMEVAMPWAMHLFAPGFAAVPGKMELTTELTRITFPYLLLVSLVSLQGGVLNSLGRFAAAAAAPVILNLALIAALLGLTPLVPSPGHALAWGTSLAGVIQFLWLLAALRREGVSLRPVWPRLTAPVRLLMRRIVPGAVGAGVYQINLLVDTVIASLVAEGAVSFLYYADRINQLPLGVVGIAVGTALLPALSRDLRGGRTEAAMHSQNRALEFALLLTLPAAAAMMALAHPIVSVLFERGRFGGAEAAATAAALIAFSSGLPAYVLIKVLAPAFFAREDTATPVKVAALALVANVALNLLLMKPLGHVGIALATALSAWINCAVLAGLLRRRGGLVLDARLRRRLPRILLASVVLAGLLAAADAGLAPLWADPSLAVRAGLLAALVVGGLLAFALLAQITGAATLGELKRAARRGAA